MSVSLFIRSAFMLHTLIFMLHFLWVARSVHAVCDSAHLLGGPIQNLFSGGICLPVSDLRYLTTQSTWSTNVITTANKIITSKNSTLKGQYKHSNQSTVRTPNSVQGVINTFQAIPLISCRGQGVNLTTHLHLAPKLRMRRSIPPLPHTTSWRLRLRLLPNYKKTVKQEN